jgi:hypothetical protein
VTCVVARCRDRWRHRATTVCGHPGEDNRSRGRFDFVFDGDPLHGEVGGDGVSVFLLAPNARTARAIVAMVCHAGCNKPFPGPTG